MLKAVRIEAPGAVALVEIAAPLPAPGEVRLRLTHVGFCGSDLSSYQGRNPMVSFPRVPGHEIAAIVDKSGAWFSFGAERLGQGRDNVRAFLQEHTDIRDQIETKLLEHLGFADYTPPPAPEVVEDDEGM